MRFALLSLLISAFNWAADTDAMTPDQRRLYDEATQSVAAPCCNNMIPVAYHESQWAFDIRDVIAERVLAGDSKREIFSQLENLEFGSERRHVTFTVPDRDLLGYFAWASPFLIVIVGALGIFTYVRMKGSRKRTTDDELIQTYRELILAQAQSQPRQKRS